MKRCFQYALVLALVASMAASSQAEICPMKMQSQQAQPCGMSMPAMTAPHHATQPASGHDCCPKGAPHHKAAQPQCPTVELSACMSRMTCCSLDPQPAQLLSQVVAIQQPATVAIASPLPLPSRASMVYAAPLPTPQNPVFRLKEDLRI